jgi:MFS superfamily sulfate permease-like transporter
VCVCVCACVSGCVVFIFSVGIVVGIVLVCAAIVTFVLLRRYAALQAARRAAEHIEIADKRPEEAIYKF